MERKQTNFCQLIRRRIRICVQAVGTLNLGYRPFHYISKKETFENNIRQRESKEQFVICSKYEKYIFQRKFC